MIKIFCRPSRKVFDIQVLMQLEFSRQILGKYILDFKLSPSSECRMLSIYLPANEDGTECSETLAYKLQTPANYPEKKSMQQIVTCQIS
jgi:hypothetical protein